MATRAGIERGFLILDCNWMQVTKASDAVATRVHESFDFEAPRLDSQSSSCHCMFMWLDHFVIHIDTDPQFTQRLASETTSLGLAFDPIGNRDFDSFSAHYLYVGLEYLEIIQLKKPNESGWVPQWVERYSRGVRGMYCLFLATSDIESLAKELQAKGFDVKEERSSFVDATGIEHPFPWRQIFMPSIPETEIELSFIQYDSVRTDLREIFEPNSDSNGFTGIQKADFLITNLDGGREFLVKIFPQLQGTESGFRIELESGEINFRRGNTESLRLTARGTNTRFNPGRLKIANVSLETAIE